MAFRFSYMQRTKNNYYDNQKGKIMKKTILKTAAFCIAVGLNFTGCIQYIDGNVQIPDSSIVEKNSSTKLYFEDTNNDVIKEDLKNLATHLNNNEIKPNLYPISSTRSDDDHDIVTLADIKVNFENNTSKILKLNFSLDEKSNYIVANKKYSSKNEIYLDFNVICQYIFEITKNNSDLKDKFGGSWMLYLDATALNNGTLKFTTKREITRDSISEKTNLAFKNSGYQIVNNPKDADKIVYFQLTRDYQESEIKQLQKEGKNINYGVIGAGLQNQTNKMETGMKLASGSTSSGTAVGVGVGLGLAFAILDAGTDHNIILPTFKITDVKDNKSYLYVPVTISHIYTNKPIGSSRKSYFSNEQQYFAYVRMLNEEKNYYKQNQIK